MPQIELSSVDREGKVDHEGSRWHRLVVRPLLAPLRDAEILEVHGADGEPPYLVRWSDDGHEGLMFPASDATIEHFNHEAKQTKEREAQ